MRVYLDHVQYFTGKAVLDGRESEPSNVVKYPGDTIRELYVARPDGSKLPVDTFTNTPPGDSALWRLDIAEWERFDVP